MPPGRVAGCPPAAREERQGGFPRRFLPRSRGDQRKIEREKQRLGVAREKQVEEKDRRENGGQQLPNRKIEHPFQQAVERKADDASYP